MTVTAPQGFRSSGVAAGLKEDALDLALVVNDGPLYVASGRFTANRVQAAPVIWSKQVLAAAKVRAVVLNSGGANACTGSEGFANVHHTAEAIARELGCSAAEVAVCSTGLIGEQLPIELLLDAIPESVQDLSDRSAEEAAEAILTTDTVAKTAVRDNGEWTIGAMAKGAGMLAPSLATMLVTITTDALIDSATANAALEEACRYTFDRLDADGSMSTNDTVLLLASGASGFEADPEEFTAELTALCHDLAQQILADAEGSTKDISIAVVNAASEDDAVDAGRAIARDNLVKTALFGSDPNWGRILAAVGTSDAKFHADDIDVAINGVVVCQQGAAAQHRSEVDISERAVDITIDLHAGEHNATVWTNDLSHTYVHENSAYSS